VLLGASAANGARGFLAAFDRRPQGALKTIRAAPGEPGSETGPRRPLQAAGFDLDHRTYDPETNLTSGTATAPWFASASRDISSTSVVAFTRHRQIKELSISSQRLLDWTKFRAADRRLPARRRSVKASSTSARRLSLAARAHQRQDHFVRHPTCARTVQGLDPRTDGPTSTRRAAHRRRGVLSSCGRKNWRRRYSRNADALHPPTQPLHQLTAKPEYVQASVSWRR